jgi:hypothetical protein
VDSIDSLTGPELVSAAAAVVLTAAWLAAVAFIRWKRRPNDPPAGPATLDLGEEPPAVVNLLANGFRVTRDAVPATLLDLAARRIVEIEQTHPGTYQCRLRSEQAAHLTAYERRVLDVLRTRALDGVVPAQALTTGPADESKRWWGKFKGEVVDDAQQRGLSRDLWDRRTLRALTVAAVAPAVFVAPLTLRAGFVYAVGAFLAIGFLKAGRRQRDTPAGLAAASRWLGLRSRLADDEVFPTVPPIAVAMWERYLAYGAAFGVAAGAVRAIPMGAESDRRAWSSYGGRWREVRIRYPRLFPLGLGRSPAEALIRAVPAAVAAFFLLSVIGGAATDQVEEEGPAPLIAVALLLVPAVVALLAAIVIIKALADLGSPREVTGQIVRLRTFGSDDSTRFYVAVDDGATRTIRAWRVGSQLYARLTQYEEVTAAVTPHLRHVRSIRRILART